MKEVLCHYIICTLLSLWSASKICCCSKPQFYEFLAARLRKVTKILNLAESGNGLSDKASGSVSMDVLGKLKLDFSGRYVCKSR